MVGTLKQTACASREEGGTTSSHHGPYAQGDTRATMVGTAGRYLVTGANLKKPVSVRIGGLQLDLHEAGIASNRASAMAR